MRAFRAAIFGSLTLLIVSQTGCGAAAGEGPQRSAVLFDDNCARCHGDAGHGKPHLEAPGIAGLPNWYVEAQLVKFRTGVRGAHGEDIAGLRMRPMSRTIPQGDVAPLSVYVSSLAPAPAEAHLVGDATAGKAHYGACAGCHGVSAEGNKAMNAPPIGLLPSWYIQAQLVKFRGGIRGAHPDDVTGQQMAPMARILPNDKAVADVASYISTL